eukprot:TRINITY_DN6548_c0_g1_i1.p1 TRINITY_DN6548_c0_g1~~TRINITY_DN6548_c0_g1_i1.p1  ORF type:complete len:206 (-),score=22.25 TRINITY_DN6548_c0_g1_i1:28-645(-)
MSSAQALKVVIVGDMGVGKTTLLSQFVNKKPRLDITIVWSEIVAKRMEIDGKNVSLRLWDTAGQEKFGNMPPAYSRGADVCMLVFDVSKARTFDNLWITNVMQNNSFRSLQIPFVLVGNKFDLKDAAVTNEQVRAWCEANPSGARIEYVEISAMTGTNVQQAFELAARKGLEFKVERPEENIQIARGPAPRVWGCWPLDENACSI